MILEKIHPEIKNLPTELFKVMKNRGGKTFNPTCAMAIHEFEFHL